MLKILVVDDDIAKIRNILAALASVPDCALENVDRATSATDAKRLLRENQYDLLILDIALPDRPDKIPSPEGGIGLLQEIVDRKNHYFRPKHIVGLTAFPEILTRFVGRFAEDLWMVIQYDANSTSWGEQLRRKVEYILLTERSHPISNYGVYLGVVTALQTPELDAVLETIPWGWSKSQLSSDASCYFKGEFQKDGERREVVAVAAPRMGMTTAAVVSMKLISSFRPRYLAMVGISGGIEGRCQIGDVVVADPSWDSGSGKIASFASGSQFEPAPHQVNLDSFLRAKLSLLKQDEAALDAIRRSWKRTPIDTVLRMHIGPVASGSSVLADKDAAVEIIKQHRKVLAIEMETYGVYVAAQEAALPQPKAFSMKAVCDFADCKKNDDHQFYAAFTSAQSLRIFVEKYL